MMPGYDAAPVIADHLPGTRLSGDCRRSPAGTSRRNDATSLGLSALFVLSLVVTACGGSSADIKKVGLVTDVGTLEDKSFNEAAWLGAQAGAADISGKASNIVTKAPADYATNIKTFVDQGYGVIVTVGFAMGDATAAAAKQYPNVKFIGVDQGVCVDPTGKSDPTFACKGDPKTLVPNYQGLTFRRSRSSTSPACSPAASRSRASSARSVGSTRSWLSSATSMAIAMARVGRLLGERQGCVCLDGYHEGLQRPGHRQVDRAADDRPEGRRHLPAAGLSGAGAIEAACATRAWSASASTSTSRSRCHSQPSAS
jgi:hypothetical protein